MKVKSDEEFKSLIHVPVLVTLATRGLIARRLLHPPEIFQARIPGEGCQFPSPEGSILLHIHRRGIILSLKKNENLPFAST